jgi:3-methyladenine DNA glycosylase AlkC
MMFSSKAIQFIMTFTQEQVNEMIASAVASVLKEQKISNLQNLSFDAKCELAGITDDVEILKVLSTDEDSWVRYWVALNPNTPVEVLRVLSTDEDYYVRRWVANNPNTPVEVLEVLSTDEYYYVRRYVAENPNTPVEVLKILSTDKNYDVRYSVAENPNYIKEND